MSEKARKVFEESIHLGKYSLSSIEGITKRSPEARGCLEDEGDHCHWSG